MLTFGWCEFAGGLFAVGNVGSNATPALETGEKVFAVNPVGAMPPGRLLQHMITRDQRDSSGCGMLGEGFLDGDVGIAPRVRKQDAEPLKGLACRAVGRRFAGVEHDESSRQLGGTEVIHQQPQQSLAAALQVSRAVIQSAQPRGMQQIVTVDQEKTCGHDDLTRSRSEFWASCHFFSSCHSCTFVSRSCCSMIRPSSESAANGR